MAQVQQGDQAAYQLLVRRHAQGLQSFAQRLLRQPDDADDVAQETLFGSVVQGGSGHKKVCS